MYESKLLLHLNLDRAEDINDTLDKVATRGVFFDASVSEASPKITRGIVKKTDKCCDQQKYHQLDQ